MTTTIIHDLDDPRLAPYRDLRNQAECRNSGRFIAEGWRVVKRLLDSPVECESILISERRAERFAEEFGQSANLFIIPQKQAETLVGYNFHAGVLAYAVRPENVSFSKLKSQSGPILCCPHITGPDNLGSMIRLLRGFGGTGLLIGSKTADPYLRRVVRVSMGTIFDLPIRQTDNLAAELSDLKEAGFQILAAEESENSTPLDLHKPAGEASKQILIVGNEDEGVTKALLTFADEICHIRMAADVDSLNVAAATGIFLYEMQRGR